MDLQWVFGVSSDTRGGVVDLRTATNTSIAYAAGHIIVIYDPSQHRQMFLQGHVHQVQCLSACPTKRFIVSADCGPDAMLIVWNSANGQHCLRINTNDQDELVTNGKDSVFFWKCFKAEQSNKSVEIVLKREQAMAKHVEMQKSMCEFTLSSFVPSSDSAITGMISGEVIFWQEPRSPFCKEPSKLFSSAIENENYKKELSARRMHAVKIVRLHHSTITHLSVQDNYVVTGGSDGYVRFYDRRLGLVGWFEELQAGEITSLSFSAMNDCKQESTGSTLQVPPFVVGTKKGRVVFLHCAISEEQPGSLLNKGLEIMDYVPKMVKCVSAHPRLPQFAIINADGLFQVQEWLESLVGRISIDLMGDFDLGIGRLVWRDSLAAWLLPCTFILEKDWCNTFGLYLLSPRDAAPALGIQESTLADWLTVVFYGLGPGYSLPWLEVSD